MHNARALFFLSSCTRPRYVQRAAQHKSFRRHGCPQTFRLPHMYVVTIFTSHILKILTPRAHPPPAIPFSNPPTTSISASFSTGSAEGACVCCCSVAYNQLEYTHRCFARVRYACWPCLPLSLPSLFHMLSIPGVIWAVWKPDPRFSSHADDAEGMPIHDYVTALCLYVCELTACSLIFGCVGVVACLVLVCLLFGVGVCTWSVRFVYCFESACARL